LLLVDFRLLLVDFCLHLVYFFGEAHDAIVSSGVVTSQFGPAYLTADNDFCARLGPVCSEICLVELLLANARYFSRLALACVGRQVLVRKDLITFGALELSLLELPVRREVRLARLKLVA